jgi:nucleoside-diphosphate-sugar epimerase
VVVGEVGPDTDWTAALTGADAVVHLAARVHVLREDAADPRAEFNRVNVAGTERLAREAARLGVRRLVFASSVGVYGGSSGPQALDERSPVRPHTAYAESKWEGEQALRRVSEETGLEVVTLRPPMVYGPRCPGNFERLRKLVAAGAPLPLGSVRNQRSMVYIGNLVSAFQAALTHPDAAGQSFLVADAEALSTAALVRRMADLLGRPARLVPVPVPVLRTALQVTGRGGMFEQLAGTLVVSSQHMRDVVGWTAPYDLETGLRATLANSEPVRGGASVIPAVRSPSRSPGW